MKAVNLIPADARRSGGKPSSELRVPIYALVGLLVGALALVTVSVLAGNTIAARKAQLANLQTQLTSEQAVASRLGSYAQFASVAQGRVATVRQIAATRFDWHAVLFELARLVPGNTSLISLQGTVAPGASAGGSGGGSSGGSSNLRSAIASPAMELSGCTSSQDDVARLMSRLRLIQGVARVTLGASVKAATGGSTGGTGSSGGCPAGEPSFDVVVFFGPLPGAGPTGAASAGAASAPVAGRPAIPSGAGG